ncbi:MAG: hypothetical protein JXR78_16595 [Victivallales bacterium]|nr:hypothetical protein [Victivallales bacterium]
MKFSELLVLSIDNSFFVNLRENYYLEVLRRFTMYTILYGSIPLKPLNNAQMSGVFLFSGGRA